MGSLVMTGMLGLIHRVLTRAHILVLWHLEPYARINNRAKNQKASPCRLCTQAAINIRILRPSSGWTCWVFSSHHIAGAYSVVV